MGALDVGESNALLLAGFPEHIAPWVDDERVAVEEIALRLAGAVDADA